MFDENYKIEMGWADIPKVEAAAIRDSSGKVWSLPPPSRHHDVGRMMIEAGYPAPFPIGDAQGFLMSDGTFADRRYAKDCAEHHRQLLDPAGARYVELFSEDLW